MKLLCILALLAGCSGSVTQIPQLDRVLTVEQFNAQPGLRDQVLDFCANNPGQTMLDPNCINVKQAVRMAMFGDGADAPRLNTAAPVFK